MQINTKEPLAVHQPVDAAMFKASMSNLPGPVTVVTTADEDGKPNGATLSAAMSLSLDPPMVLVSFDKLSDTLRTIKSSGKLRIHVLGSGQSETAMAFAKKGPEKFEKVQWTRDAEGLPILPGCVSVMACVLHEAVDAGDHVIVIASVGAIELNEDREPLVYARRRMIPFGQADLVS